MCVRDASPNRVVVIDNREREQAGLLLRMKGGAGGGDKTLHVLVVLLL